MRLKVATLSFESGRKLGLVASLIAVIAPVITGALYVLSFLSLFNVSPLGFVPSPVFGLPLFSWVEVTFIVIGVLGLVGFVMFLVSMHRLSRYYDEPAIFKNVLNGFLVGVIGAAVIVSILVALLALVFFHAVPSGIPAAWLVIVSIFGLLVAAIVFTIVSAIFYKRAFDALAQRSGSYSFNTAGSLYLWGAALTIVFVGSLLIWIAWIFAFSGFHSLKPKAAKPTAPFPTMQPPATFSARRYCQYCGAENAQDAVYCQACGRQIPASQ